MNASKFHTIVDIPVFRWQTGYSKKNMFLGSCFTENIGTRMEGLKYNVDINPFGILYNPVSVANGLKILLHNKEFTSADLIERGGLWHSFFHHGRFSSPNEKETLEAINSKVKSGADFLRKADFLFITFGTAWVYRYKKTGQFVSNCHKIPANEFERVRLSVDEIVQEYNELFTEIRKINSSLKVIFTVSPIRHWKDGAIENQRSKAVLLLAIEKLIREFGDDFCAYFPAYEIVMDELRDYRFFAEDMVHLTDVAVNHVWEKFGLSLIDSESREISKRVHNIVQAFNHKPLHPKSTEYSKFLDQIVKQVNRFKIEFPNINFGKELGYFNAEIKEIENKTS